MAKMAEMTFKLCCMDSLHFEAVYRHRMAEEGLY